MSWKEILKEDRMDKLLGVLNKWFFGEKNATGSADFIDVLLRDVRNGNETIDEFLEGEINGIKEDVLRGASILPIETVFEYGKNINSYSDYVEYITDLEGLLKERLQ